jgi:hypothetical protein
VYISPLRFIIILLSNNHTFFWIVNLPTVHMQYTLFIHKLQKKLDYNDGIILVLLTTIIQSLIKR